MSALRCKVGDLAIVVSARLEKNIGQIVEDMAAADPSHGLRERTHAWVVRTASGRRALHYRDLTGRIVKKATGPVPDRRLVPFRADLAPAVVNLSEKLGLCTAEQVRP